MMSSGIGAFALLFIAATIIGGINRSAFGEFYGNFFLLLETASAIAAYFFWRLRKSGKNKLAVLVAGYSLAALFGALAWFVHPNQVVDRADRILGDREHAISAYRQEQQFGERDPQAGDRIPKMLRELHSKKMEYSAAVNRFQDNDSFFRDRIYSVVLSVIAIVLLIATRWIQTGAGANRK